MARRRGSVASTRSSLYTAARLLGDWQAAKNGRIGGRLRRRLIGRALSRLIR